MMNYHAALVGRLPRLTILASVSVYGTGRGVTFGATILELRQPSRTTA